MLTGPGRLEVLESEGRALRTGEARVRVEAAGICGSDLHGYHGVTSRRHPGVVMGHEFVGRVVEGPGIGIRVAVNPLVACGTCVDCAVGQENLCATREVIGSVPELPGGLASEVVAPAANCVPIDGDADPRGLVLTEPLAVGVHAVRLAAPEPGTPVLVLGGGTVGLAVGLACLDAGAEPVVRARNPVRRALLERAGLRTCAPGDAGDAYRLVIDCVGRDETVGEALARTRPGGAVVVVGLVDETFTLPGTPLVLGERRILGSYAYTMHDFREAARAAERRADVLAPLVAVVPDLEGVAAAFDDEPRGALKTAFVPSGHLRAG